MKTEAEIKQKLNEKKEEGKEETRPNHKIFNGVGWQMALEWVLGNG